MRNVVSVVGLIVYGSPAAIAQSPITGPRADVTVADIADATSYGSGPPGSGAESVFAYDLGTVTCNAGSENVLWVANTPSHPVIAQNVFRIADGRIVQIGMSWVKHAFGAVIDDACGYGCNGQGGSVLGVGCSDPYTLGVNGIQFFLGPRSLINPATGVFAYEPNTWPPIQNAVSRRMQVQAADIDPQTYPGAVFIGEAVYVAPDDAANGNAFNNAAYRPVQFAPPGDVRRALNVVPGSPTRRNRPAVFAWKDVHPDVLVVPVDIPGDGQLFVASRATPLGGGQWRYDYAVQNQSSARAVRAWRVPLWPGDAPSSLFFASPRWHSGESVANTPWDVSTTTDALTWSTPDPAVSPTAPILFWGTLGAFGFVSSHPPIATTGTLTLAGPPPISGPGVGVLNTRARIVGPAPANTSPPVPVPGDGCSAPLPAHPGTNGASANGAAPSGLPGCAPADPPGPDLWWFYTFNDACAGPITFSTCGTTFECSLAVFDGSTCPSSAAVPLDCTLGSDMPCSFDMGLPGPGQCSVTLNISAGQSVLIRVSALSMTLTPDEHVVLTITPPRCAPPPTACCVPASGLCFTVGTEAACTSQGGVWRGVGSTCSPNPCPQPPRPPNDLCTNALELADTLVGGVPLAGTNVNAFNDGTIPCESGGRDVWYRYVPATNAAVTVDLCATPATDFSDTVLQVLSSCSGPAVGCNDDACGGRSRVTFDAIAGAEYFIRVMGFSGTQGHFSIAVAGGGGLGLGACCRGVTCALTASASCLEPGSQFVRAVACNAPTVPNLPCCRADFDQSGVVGVQDVFDFVAAWFAGEPRADWTGNGAQVPGIESIFAFLAGWFAGC